MFSINFAFELLHKVVYVFAYLFPQKLDFLLLTNVFVRVEYRDELFYHCFLELAFFEHLFCQVDLLLVGDVSVVDEREKLFASFFNFSLDLFKVRL